MSFFYLLLIQNYNLRYKIIHNLVIKKILKIWFSKLEYAQAALRPPVKWHLMSFIGFNNKYLQVWMNSLHVWLWSFLLHHSSGFFSTQKNIDINITETHSWGFCGVFLIHNVYCNSVFFIVSSD